MGGNESRVYIAEMKTGAALVKRKSGDCPCDVEPLRDVLQSDDGMWKVECYALDSEDRPFLLYIRNDHHPQRALNSAGNLVNCSMRAGRDDERWLVEDTAETESTKKIFALKNKASGKYLSVDLKDNRYGLAFQESPTYWFASLAKHAPSPWQVFTYAAVAPIAAAAAAVTTVLSAGTAAVGWGTAFCAGSAAVGVIYTTVKDVMMDPASKEWVVDKM